MVAIVLPLAQKIVADAAQSTIDVKRVAGALAAASGLGTTVARA